MVSTSMTVRSDIRVTSSTARPFLTPAAQMPGIIIEVSRIARVFAALRPDKRGDGNGRQTLSASGLGFSRTSRVLNLENRKTRLRLRRIVQTKEAFADSRCRAAFEP